MTSSSSDVLKDKAPSKDLAWWVPNIDHKITPEVRHVLETYSNIPSSEVLNHVYAIREKAWSIRPWPCTGMGGFFSPTLSKLPVYPMILRTVKAGGNIIDVGCYCGTDLRRLVIDGCPQSSLYGTDFVNHWDLGYELYRDEQKFKVRYIEADILDPNAELLESFAGKMDIVSAIHLLHNWDLHTQIKAATGIASLTKPESKVVGIQVGTRSNDSSKCISEETKEGFAPHSVASFARMWDEVGKATGTVWITEAEMRDWADFGYGVEETKYLGAETGMLQFVVTRIR